MTSTFKEGTRVKSKYIPNRLGVVLKDFSDKLKMVQLRWDSTPNIISWCKKSHLEITDERVGYYLASVVIKVDLNKEHWETQGNIDFGIQTILWRNGFDGLVNKNDMGVTMVGYKPIVPNEFNKLKYAFFTNPGDF